MKQSHSVAASPITRHSGHIRTVWGLVGCSNSHERNGGGDNLNIMAGKSINAGDSCNTSVLTMPSHAGTHVDSPYHFLATGKSVEQSAPEDWFFDAPFVVFFKAVCLPCLFYRYVAYYGKEGFAREVFLLIGEKGRKRDGQSRLN